MKRILYSPEKFEEAISHIKNLRCNLIHIEASDPHSYFYNIKSTWSIYDECKPKNGSWTTLDILKKIELDLQTTLDEYNNGEKINRDN